VYSFRKSLANPAGLLAASMWLVMAVPSLVLSQAGDEVSQKAERQGQAGQVGEAGEEVMRLEREYLDARVKNDQAALDRILADDYVAVESSGNVSTDKKAYLGFVPPATVPFTAPRGPSGP
jgi:hypothetical protein